MHGAWHTDRSRDVCWVSCAFCLQDRFFTELRESSDGFSVVAEHFGRGLMNMTAASIAQQGLEKLGVAVAPTQSFSSAA